MSGRRLALAVTLVAVATVATSILMHPPSAYRADRLDQRRGWDLQQLSLQIGAYWRSRHELPADIGALVKDQTVDPKILRDPASGEAYHYRVLNKTSYQLCASITHPEQIREYHNLTQVVDEAENGRACYKYVVQVAR